MKTNISRYGTVEIKPNLGVFMGLNLQDQPTITLLPLSPLVD